MGGVARAGAAISIVIAAMLSVLAGAAAGAVSQVAAPTPSGIPLPLMALTAVSLAVFAAGGLGYLVRRRREQQQT